MSADSIKAISELPDPQEMTINAFISQGMGPMQKAILTATVMLGEQHAPKNRQILKLLTQQSTSITGTDELVNESELREEHEELEQELERQREGARGSSSMARRSH